MGWTYPFNCETRKDLVDYLRRTTTGVKVHRSSAVGNEFWALVEAPDGRVFAWLWLLKGGTRQYPGWGYKDLSHRDSVDCPVDYLRFLPETEDAQELEWRDAVRAHHRKVTCFKREKKALTPGTKVTFNGKAYRLVESLGTRGWKVHCLDDHQDYRMPVKHLNKALREMLKA